MDGNLFEDGLQIKEQAVSFFSNLFQANSVIPDEGLFLLAGPTVSKAQNQFLVAILSPEEIRNAVFHLKKSSSPGPDGFSGVFFTSCWHLVSREVTEAVTHFFTSGHPLRETNAFFISLIPKISSPESFSDFRPISLLNFIYKISSKILASRLFTILPLLISHRQSAFVKGRSIHHNVALAHDIIQKLNSKISGGSVCLKMDISKAFDKLQWNFLF